VFPYVVLHGTPPSEATSALGFCVLVSNQGIALASSLSSDMSVLGLLLVAEIRIYVFSEAIGAIMCRGHHRDIRFDKLIFFQSCELDPMVKRVLFKPHKLKKFEAFKAFHTCT